LLLQIHGTCLGFQLLQILVSNVSRNDLLVETDSVSHATTMEWTGLEGNSRSFKNLSVSWEATVLGKADGS
jgi:gamma-glutamyl hydrolase